MKLAIPRIRAVGLLLSAVLVTAAVSGAQAQTRYGRQTTRHVLSQMHHINQMEIRMGQLAMTKGQSREVRDFGRRLRNDHQASDRSVLNLAAREDIQLRGMPMTANERATHRRLMSASGSRFDREFLDAMASGHTDAMQELRQARRNARDPQLIRLISNTLPAMRHHRNMARQYQDQI